MSDRTHLITTADRLRKMAADVETSHKERGVALDKQYPRFKRLERRLRFLEEERAAEACLALDDDETNAILDALDAKVDILRPYVESLQRRVEGLERPTREIARTLRYRAERLRAIGPRILQGVPEPKKPKAT